MYDFILSEERTSLYKILAEPPEDKKQNSSIILNVRLGGLEIHEENHKYQLVKLSGYYKRWIANDRKER
jgi:hypothetical protein